LVLRVLEVLAAELVQTVVIPCFLASHLQAAAVAVTLEQTLVLEVLEAERLMVLMVLGPLEHQDKVMLVGMVLVRPYMVLAAAEVRVP
jgi:hypothetical protein